MRIRLHPQDSGGTAREVPPPFIRPNHLCPPFASPADRRPPYFLSQSGRPPLPSVWIVSAS